MRNSDVAAILEEVADLLELKAVSFKPNAYRKAARSIREMKQELEEYRKKEDLRAIVSNYTARWTDQNTLGTGSLYDNTTQVGIGTTNPGATLDVAGNIRLGAAGANNLLNTSAAGGAPSGNLYWGNRTVVDSSNVSAYATTAVTAGSGLTGGGTVGPLTINVGAGNGITVNANDITIDATTSGTTSTTGANSGLEVTAGGLRMLGGCSNGQVLAWDSTNAIWECTTSSGGLSGSGAATQVAFWTGASALSGENNVWWNNTTDRLGIGTSAPGVALDVVGEVELNQYIYFANGSSEYIRWDTSDFILTDDLLPSAADTNNLGSTAAEWNSAYLADGSGLTAGGGLFVGSDHRA